MRAKIYLVITEDRHTDIDVEPFVDSGEAIAFAKEQVGELNRRPEDIQEQQIDGWLYYCEYSVESDSVRVIEKELN